MSEPNAGRFNLQAGEEDGPASSDGLPLSILVLDFGGYDFISSFAGQLGSRGHKVVHSYCSSVASPKGRETISQNVVSRPIRLFRPFQKYGMRRLFSEIGFGLRAARLVRETRPDVTIASNMPVISQWLAYVGARSASSAYVFWLQDIFGVALSSDRLATGLLKRLRIARSLGAIERHCIRHADHVVAISASIAEYTRLAGASAERVTIQPNWCDTAAVRPVDRDNLWAREKRLPEGYRFVYAGTLGLKHPSGLLRKLATHLAENGGHLIVVAEGPGVLELKGQEQSPGLVIYGYQPFDRLSEVLSAGDVMVAVLESDAADFSVPSKITSYLSAGRPVLASIAASNEAAKELHRSGSALVVEPGDDEAFLSAADQYLEMTDDELRLMGVQARTYAEVQYDLDAITQRLDKVLRKATRERSKRSQDRFK